MAQNLVLSSKSYGWYVGDNPVDKTWPWKRSPKNLRITQASSISFWTLQPHTRWVNFTTVAIYLWPFDSDGTGCELNGCYIYGARVYLASITVELAHTQGGRGCSTLLDPRLCMPPLPRRQKPKSCPIFNWICSCAKSGQERWGTTFSS